MGTWTETNVGGHPGDVFEPARQNEFGFVVLYLNGGHSSRLKEHPRFGECFDQFGLPVVAPRAGRCWWVNRICPDFDPSVTPEKYILGDVLPYIEQRWQSKTPQIGLLGTSMGGQGALRFAYKYP